ncbi:multicopper oxidase family protein [Streptomyces sp. NPDC021212]|uniref:multicopper oxidase family protein n=1 Tax=Streptomyces sp. NPDC021212 TaxID=3365118 RepID=UPI0037919B51
MHEPSRLHEPSRRAVLGAGVAAAGGGLLGACSSPGGENGMDDSGLGGHAGPAAATPSEYISPHGTEVQDRERRRGPGPVRRLQLTATATTLDLGARKVKSWAYEDQVPGQALRVTAGETLALTLVNQLPQPTTLHWHGVRLRNDMDGVPGITQPPIKTGTAFDYRFTVLHPGTYWVHPHSSVQLDRGLYAPLIVEDPREPLAYDKEWIVVLDDWLDGVGGRTPDKVLRQLNGGRPMAHGTDAMTHGATTGASGPPPMSRHGGRPTPSPTAPSRPLTGATSELLGGEAGHVAYPYYLINGRTPDSPQVFRAKRGDRIRIRIINAGSDTAFRVALGGHKMTVTHTDGYPVRPTTTDALLLGMGERYDVLVTAKSGVFPFAALAEGKRRSTLAVLHTSGQGARKFKRPKELNGKLVQAGRLKAAESVRLEPRLPDRTLRLRLTGSMRKFDWAINGRPYDPTQRYPVREGERVRLTFINGTDMWHPMHVHGHTYALPDGGPRKDTVILLPHRKVTLDFDADNPGLWMVHCHNVYHSESGMMTILGYQK